MIRDAGNWFDELNISWEKIVKKRKTLFEFTDRINFYNYALNDYDVANTLYVNTNNYTTGTTTVIWM